MHDLSTRNIQVFQFTGSTFFLDFWTCPGCDDPEARYQNTSYSTTTATATFSKVFGSGPASITVNCGS